MKKIKLTTWERVQLAIVIGAQVPNRGTVAAVRLGCKALDVLEFTEEEKRRIGWTVFPDGSVQWSLGYVESEWPLEFSDSVWEFVKRRTENHTNWPINRLVDTLLDKILGEEVNDGP